VRIVIEAGDLKAVTDPIDVLGPAVGGRTLVHENTLCSKPNPQKDAESLEYVPEDDAFWLADDNGPSIFSVDRSTGAFLSRLTSAEFLAAFPSAAFCDDGDNDPTTSCSYTDEFELLAYDRGAGALYVMNTVNDPDQIPIQDRPALFRLLRGGCSGCWAFDSWRALPPDADYDAIAVIEGDLYLAIGRDVYRYDYDTNRLMATNGQGDSLPPAFTATSNIQRLHFDGSHLWVVVSAQEVIQIDWQTRAEVARYEVGSFGISVAKGVEALEGQLYVLDGDPPNPIYVFRPLAGL
jgi:hypothetical protein